MKRGFPRPTMQVEKLRVWSLKDNDWTPKALPIPYSARTDNISAWHYGRLWECVNFKRCMVCGLPVKGDVVWIYRSYGHLEPDSGPFHEKCTRQTKTLCPLVAKQTNRFTWHQEEWAQVVPEIRAAYRKGSDSPEGSANT